MFKRPDCVQELRAIKPTDQDAIARCAAMMDHPELKKWAGDTSLDRYAHGYYAELCCTHGLAYAIHRHGANNLREAVGWLSMALLYIREATFDHCSEEELADRINIGLGLVSYLWRNDTTQEYLQKVRKGGEWYGFALAIIGRIEVEISREASGVNSLAAATRAGIKGRRMTQVVRDVLSHVTDQNTRCRPVLPLPKKLRLSGYDLTEL